MFKNIEIKLAIASVFSMSLVACGDGTLPTTITISADDDEVVIVEEETDAISEATALLDALAAMGGTPFTQENATDFPEAYNVFMPSVTGVDLNLVGEANPSGPTARIPMFEGVDPAGNPVDYIITEASDQDVADLMGIVYAPRMANVADSAGAQLVTLENGIMQFLGTVDFSPTRSVTPGDATATEGPNSITRSVFPPAAVQPGAIADDEWSSIKTTPTLIVSIVLLFCNCSMAGKMTNAISFTSSLMHQCQMLPQSN